MALLRLVLGLVKGAIIGGAIGYGAYALGLGGALGWVIYGLVGVAVGLLVGRPVWSHLRDKHSTIWVSIIKSLFGFGIGAGLYALAGKVWSGPELTIMGDTRPLLDFQYVLGGAIGALYGAWVEADDAPKKPESPEPKDAGEGDQASG
jgi:hypothetical protein